MCRGQVSRVDMVYGHPFLEWESKTIFLSKTLWKWIDDNPPISVSSPSFDHGTCEYSNKKQCYGTKHDVEYTGDVGTLK